MKNSQLVSSSSSSNSSFVNLLLCFPMPSPGHFFGTLRTPRMNSTVNGRFCDGIRLRRSTSPTQLQKEELPCRPTASCAMNDHFRRSCDRRPSTQEGCHGDGIEFWGNACVASPARTIVGRTKKIVSDFWLLSTFRFDEQWSGK